MKTSSSFFFFFFSFQQRKTVLKSGFKHRPTEQQVSQLVALPSQVVQHSHVGVGVVQVVGVGGVVLLCPVGRQRTVQVEDVLLRFGLVVHAVEAHHLLEPAGKKKEDHKRVKRHDRVWIDGVKRHRRVLRRGGARGDCGGRW